MNVSKIVIDGRMYSESGIGRYIRNLLDKLQLIDKQNQYFILHRKEDFYKLEYEKNFHKILADFSWYGIKEQIKLPALLKSLNPDLVHFPHFNVPILYDGKFVVTIHDLIHQHFSMQRATTHGPIIYKLKQLGYKKVFRSAVEKAKKILVPSEFVKEQLTKDWKVDKEKVIVTHEAVDDKMLEVIDKKAGKDVIGSPYIFYVGNAHPHKNVEGLIKAFLELKKKYQSLKLVLAGHDHYFWQRIKLQFQDESIIFKGKVSDEELVMLYKNAQMFVMPSFEEGFGIPILEAMACSCPIVSSKLSALPEVGREACLYFNPLDISDLVEKISMLLNDDKLKKHMIEEGLKRYKEFSWESLAQKTLEVYLQ